MKRRSLLWMKFIFIPAMVFSVICVFAEFSFSQKADSTIRGFGFPESKDFWAFKNIGLPQRLNLSGSIPYFAQATVGQDLHLPNQIIFKDSLKPVIVAILDSGLDVQHPWIRNSLAKNGQDCSKNADQDLDGNQYPGDCYGWNLVKAILQKNGVFGDGDVKDPHGHGTHVASQVIMITEKIFGAEKNPIRILPVRVLDEKFQGLLIPNSVMDSEMAQLMSPKENAEKGMITSLGDSVARALIYAYHQGAQVINMSFSWPPTRDSAFLRKVIRYLTGKGVLIVSSAGNDESSRLPGPCSYPEVLCVGSMGPDGALSFFSNYGGVDVAAPGLQILGSFPLYVRSSIYKKSNGFEILDGTSQATPMVAALAATLLSIGEKPDQVFQRIKLTSRSLAKESTILNSDMSPLRRLTTQKVQWGAIDFDQAIHHWSKERQDLRKNVWEPAVKENIVARISDRTVQLEIPFISWGFLSQAPMSIQVSSPEQAFEVLHQAWKFQSGNQWVLQIKIQVKESSLAETWIQLHLQEKNFEKTYRIPMDLTRVVSQPSDALSQSIPFEHSLTQEQLKNSLYLSTLWSSAPQDQPEYFVTRFESTGIQLGLITSSMSKNSSSYQYQKWPFISFENIGSMPGPRLNVRSKSYDHGKAFYLFGIVADVRQQTSGGQQAYFLEVDENGKIDSEKKWFSEQAFLNDDLHWIQVQGRSRPLWIALADRQRSSDSRASWLDTKEQQEDFRRHLFFLDRDWNLKMVADLPDFEFLQIFSSNVSSQKMILARAYPRDEDALLATYAWFQYEDGLIVSKPVGTFLAPSNLIQQNFVVQAQEEVVYFQSEKGRMILTGLKIPFSARPEGFVSNQQQKSLFPSPVWQKSFQHPDEPRHGLKWLSAVLGQKDERQFLFLSHAEVVGLSMGPGFQNYSVVNLDRFSMLPSQSVLSVMFPFFVSDIRTGQKNLAIYVPQRQSVFPGLRVLSFQQVGSVQKLQVPWRYHWLVEEPCLPLSDGAVLSGQGQKFVFDSICGNTIRRHVFEDGVQSRTDH